MERPHPPRVIATGRGMGTSTALVEWLLAGRRISGPPGWSRVVVVDDERTVDWWKRTFPVLDQALRQTYPPGLAGALLSAAQMRRARRFGDGVQIALDDADEVLHRALGFMPDLITMTGIPMTLDELRAESDRMHEPPRYRGYKPEDTPAEHVRGPVDRMFDWMLDPSALRWGGLTTPHLRNPPTRGEYPQMRSCPKRDPLTWELRICGTWPLAVSIRKCGSIPAKVPHRRKP